MVFVVSGEVLLGFHYLYCFKTKLILSLIITHLNQLPLLKKRIFYYYPLLHSPPLKKSKITNVSRVPRVKFCKCSNI